jgi:hypothetical protein
VYSTSSVEDRCKKEVGVRYLMPTEQTSDDEVGEESNEEPPYGEEKRLWANECGQSDDADVDSNNTLLKSVGIWRVFEGEGTDAFRTVEGIGVGRNALERRRARDISAVIEFELGGDVQWSANRAVTRMMMECFSNLALDILADTSTKRVLVVENVGSERLLMTASIWLGEDVT